MENKPMPDGFHTVTPYLMVEEADKFIDFLKHTFEAEERSERFTNSDGVIQHVEVRIGDSMIELSEARGRFPSMQNALHVFVSDTDACYKRALEAGATSLYEPQDMPYEERSGGVKDASENHCLPIIIIKSALSTAFDDRTQEVYLDNSESSIFDGLCKNTHHVQKIS